WPYFTSMAPNWSTWACGTGPSAARASTTCHSSSPAAVSRRTISQPCSTVSFHRPTRSFFPPPVCFESSIICDQPSPNLAAGAPRRGRQPRRDGRTGGARQGHGSQDGRQGHPAAGEPVAQPLARAGEPAPDRPFLDPQAAGRFGPAVVFQTAEDERLAVGRRQALDFLVEDGLHLPPLRLRGGRPRRRRFRLPLAPPSSRAGPL